MSSSSRGHNLGMCPWPPVGLPSRNNIAAGGNETIPARSLLLSGHQCGRFVLVVARQFLLSSMLFRDQKGATVECSALLLARGMLALVLVRRHCAHGI